MKIVIAYAALSAMLTLLFLLAPGLDLAAAGWFYDPAHGFYLAASWPVWLLENAIPWLTRLIIVVALVGTGWLLFRGRPLWRLDRKALGFVVAAIAIGP